MATETDEDGEIIKHIIFAFGGDQLTEERIFNAQQGFIDARNDYEMLQGLKPAYEDWHLKRTLYEVIRKYSVNKANIIKSQQNILLKKLKKC